MPSYTNRWGLSILGSGDSLADDGYKFTDADRRLIDRLLAYASEQHRHTGDSGIDRTPVAALSLMLEPTLGSMPSGTRFYYRYTVTDDDGNESGPSPVATIDTPSSVATPQAPALSYLTGSGSLLPGRYSYVVSAFKGASSLETKAINSAIIAIDGVAVTNSVSMILPDLPLGATGLNIYRRTPSGMHYLFIDSVTAPTSGQVWIDDGATDGDCDRGLPAVNRTSNSSAVDVGFPGATPTVPDGWSWTIYRTDNPSDWGRSFLTEMVPQGATPYTPTAFLDVGGATQVGGPPTQAQVIQAPSKINLTDAAEIAGTLPPGLAVIPHVVTFTQAGPVTSMLGSFTWVCEFDQADIVMCRAYLGVDSVPAADDVIVDVNAYRPSVSPAWESVYLDGPTRPRVSVGENVGEPAVPEVRHLVAGDLLSVDVDQSGGGATPTDDNLTVNVLLYVQHGSETTSHSWAV